MRFRDNRITLRKNMLGAEIPENFDPDVLATPREVVERSLTRGIRTVPNRSAQRSQRVAKPRQHRRGVSVTDKPWEQKEIQHYEVDNHGAIRRDGKVVHR